MKLKLIPKKKKCFYTKETQRITFFLKNKFILILQTLRYEIFSVSTSFANNKLNENKEKIKN